MSGVDVGVCVGGMGVNLEPLYNTCLGPALA